MTDLYLRRFRIELEAPIGGFQAFGVTAIDLDDARGLILRYLRALLDGLDALPPSPV
jgi:hypothetical protein